MTREAKIKSVKSKNKIRVLSLFDGLSGAQIALSKLGADVEYFASEIDEYAMKITRKNFPGTVQLGDVTKLDETNLPRNINLLIGGSPCQDLSVSNNSGAGLSGEKSRLFWEYVRILEIVKPKFFVLENVESMKTRDFVIITNTLGVEPVMLDAALVSAQRRKRYFWTNIPNVKKPADRRDPRHGRDLPHGSHVGNKITARSERTAVRRLFRRTLGVAVDKPATV